MRHKIYEWYEVTRLFFVFRVPIGYPRAKVFIHALPADKILYPYPPIKFHTYTLTRRVGYPRVKLTSLTTGTVSVLDGGNPTSPSRLSFIPELTKRFLALQGWRPASPHPISSPDTDHRKRECHGIVPRFHITQLS